VTGVQTCALPILCVEDKDGFEDDDGCPELDNDKDGIPDAADKCPTEAETLNAVDDFDGCADEGGIQIASFDGERILVERAPPFDRKGLTQAGALIVDQVALTMLQQPDVTHWLVALAAPKVRDAERQGQAVRAQLLKRGVSATAIELMTAAGSAKLVAVAQERRDPDEPRTCPGPEAKPRPDREVKAVPPATPTPAAPMAPTPAAAAPSSPPPTPATTPGPASPSPAGKPASATSPGSPSAPSPPRR
jgi:hypothetical protein